MRIPAPRLILPCLLFQFVFGSPANPQGFNGTKAFEHVKRVVDLGPRPPASPALEACRQYIRGQVAALGLKAEDRPFVARTPLGSAPMVNLVVRLPGKVSGKIIVGGHYDTKRVGFRFVGANDGGSSTGFLLELLRVLKNRPRNLGVEIVFFDGEESIVAWEGSDHTYGSREYVEAAKRDGSLKDIRTMVLVDMIGDKSLGIRREQASTRWLTDIVWSSAKRLGHHKIFLDESTPIEDDHIPFLAAGIPSMDIIDLEYPAWHTAEDTLDKVSPKSLQIVGDVLLDALPRIEQHLLHKQ